MSDNVEAGCAKCPFRAGSVYHRPSSECLYSGCTYDEGNVGPTYPGTERPHPTPHHAYEPLRSWFSND